MTKVRLKIGGTGVPTYIVGLEMCVSSRSEALANEVLNWPRQMRIM